MSVETFIKSLGVHILKEHDEGVVSKDALSEKLSTAMDNLPKGKFKSEMKKGFKKHLKALRKGIKKLQVEEKPIPDVEESPLDGSLAELSEHENRAEELLHPSLPKFHLAYNLYGKMKNPPHEARLQKMGREQQRHVYCMYLRQLLGRDDTTVVDITAILRKLSPFIQAEDTESKSRFDWLTPVTWLHMVAPRTQSATIKVLEVLFGEVKQDVEKCIVKCKSVRARRLADQLRKFIILNYLKISLPSLKPAEVKKYTRLMSSLLSFYVDLCRVCHYENSKQSGREVCGFVGCILGQWPEMVVEVLLQLCAISQDSAEFLLPLIRHSLSTKPTTDVHYLKYVLLVRAIKDELDSDTVNEFIVPTMDIPAPVSLLDWLQESCPDALPRMPTSNKKFKDRKVTKFILEEADEDLIAMLMDSLHNPDGIEDTSPVLEVQTDGQSPVSEATTSTRGPLFFIDKAGGKASSTAKEVGDESQAESEASLIVVDTLRDVEEIIDMDDSKKTYMLSDALMKRMNTDTAKDFLKEGIVSIKTIKTTDAVEQANGIEDNNELVLDMSDGDLSVTESENQKSLKRPDEELIIDLDSDINETEHHDTIKGKRSNVFIEIETESDMSVNYSNADENSSGKKTKLKSIVTKVNPVKETSHVEKTSVISIEDSETEYDPSEPTMTGMDTSTTSMDIGSQSESTNIADSETNESETEIETDTTCQLLTSSFDSEGTIKATAKHKNVIIDSDADADKESALQTKSSVGKEKDNEYLESKSPADKGKKTSIDEGSGSATVKRKTSGNKSCNQKRKSIGSDTETDKEKLSDSKYPPTSPKKAGASASSNTSEFEMNKTYKYVDGKPQHKSSTKKMRSDSSDAETSNTEVFESPRSSPMKSKSSQELSKKSEDSTTNEMNKSMSLSASRTKKSSSGEDFVFPPVYSGKKSASVFSSTSSFGSVEKLQKKKKSSLESSKADDESHIVSALNFKTPPAMKAILQSPSKKKAHMFEAGLVTEVFATDADLQADSEMESNMYNDTVEDKSDNSDGDVVVDTVDHSPKLSSPKVLQKKQTESKGNVKDIQDKFISKAAKSKTPKKKSESVNVSSNDDSVVSEEQTDIIETDDDNSSSNVSVPRPKKLTPKKMSDILNDTKTYGGDAKVNKDASQKLEETELRKVKGTVVESDQDGKKQQRSKSAGAIGSSSVKKSKSKTRVYSVPDKLNEQGDHPSAMIWMKAPEETTLTKKTHKPIEMIDSEDAKSKSQKQISTDNDETLIVAESPLSKTSGKKIKRTSEGTESNEDMDTDVNVKKLKTPKQSLKKTPEYMRTKKSDAEMKSPKSDQTDVSRKVLLLDKENDSESDFVVEEKVHKVTLTVLNTSEDSDDIVEMQKKKTSVKLPTVEPIIKKKDSKESLEYDISVEKRNKKIKTPIKSPETDVKSVESPTYTNIREHRKESSEFTEISTDTKDNEIKTPAKSPIRITDSDQSIDRKDLKKQARKSCESQSGDEEYKRFKKDKKMKTPVKSPSNADHIDNVKSPDAKTHSKKLLESEDSIDKKDTNMKSSVSSETDQVDSAAAENVIENEDDNEMSSVGVNKLSKLSAKKHTPTDIDIDTVVPSSQKKGNKQSPESSEFTQLHTKLKVPCPNTESSDSEADLDVVPNLSQHLKSPHVPVISDNVEKEREIPERRSLRPRRQSVMESESETEIPPRKRGRTSKEVEVKIATTPAAKKKKSDKKVSMASTTEEIVPATPEVDKADSKSTRVTRRRSVLLKTLKTPPQRAASLERKLSASTSKKAVQKTEPQKMAARKRRLSGEMLASGARSDIDSTDSEVTFPKLKKTPSVKPVPAAVTKTPKRASTAAKKGADPKTGTSFSLRKK